MKLTVRDASVFWCFIGCCYWPFGCCGACFDWLAASQRPCSSAHAVCNWDDTETLGSKSSTLVAVRRVDKRSGSAVTRLGSRWDHVCLIPARRHHPPIRRLPEKRSRLTCWTARGRPHGSLMRAGWVCYSGNEVCFIGGHSLFSERLQTHGCCRPHNDRRFPEHLHRNKHEDCCRAVTHMRHADQP